MEIITKTDSSQTNTNDSYFSNHLTEIWQSTCADTHKKIPNITKNFKKRGFLEPKELERLSTLSIKYNSVDELISALKDLSSQFLTLQQTKFTSTEAISQSPLFKGMQILTTSNFPKLKQKFTPEAAVKALLAYANLPLNEASFHAYKNKHEEVLKILLDDPTVNLRNILEEALRNWDKKVVIALLREEPPIILTLELTTSIIDSAAKNGDVQTVKVFLEKTRYADVDEADADGAYGFKKTGKTIRKPADSTTIIDITIKKASEYGETNMVKELFQLAKKECTESAINGFFETALKAASLNGHTDLVKILLDDTGVGQTEGFMISVPFPPLKAFRQDRVQKYTEVCKLLIQDSRFNLLTSSNITDSLFGYGYTDCDLVGLILRKFEKELKNLEDLDNLKLKLEKLPLLNYMNAQEENYELLAKLLSPNKQAEIEKGKLGLKDQLASLKQLEKGDEKLFKQLVDFLISVSKGSTHYQRPLNDSAALSLSKHVMNEISLGTAKALSLYMSDKYGIDIDEYLFQLKQSRFLDLVNWILTDNDAANIKKRLERKLQEGGSLAHIDFKKCLKIALDYNHYALVKWLGKLPKAREFSNSELKTRARAFLSSADCILMLVQAKGDKFPVSEDVLKKDVGDFLIGPGFFASSFRVEDIKSQNTEQIEEVETLIMSNKL